MAHRHRSFLTRKLPVVLAALALVGAARGEEPPGLAGGGPAPVHDVPHDEVSPEQAESIRLRIAELEARRRQEPARTGKAVELYPLFPLAGRLWRDTRLTSWVDVDPTSGVRDWACGSRSYDGHKGHDYAIRSFAEQSIGVPVFAVLDGEVADAHDGEFDQNTTWDNQPSNYVVLSHGEGHYTLYFHLKKDSVAVTVGQTITAGTQLGLAASSGISTGPHLHFESRLAGKAFEPNAGACRTGASFWAAQPPLDADLGPVDFILSPDPIPNEYPLFDPARRIGTFVAGEATLRFRVQLANLPRLSGYTVRVRRPDGSVERRASGPFNNAEHYLLSYWFWSWAVALDETGTWRVEIDVDGTPVVDAPFTVVGSASEIVNRAPNAVDVSFAPAAPRGSDVITCQVDTSLVTEDPDYDLVRYRYEWRVNGTLVRDVTTAALADVLPRGAAVAGDTVACTVTPSDGSLSGPQATASALVGEGPDGLAAPTGLAATRVKKKKVVLSWTDNAQGEEAYELLVHDGANWQPTGTRLAANATTGIVGGLRSKTIYRLGVRACDGADCSPVAEVTVMTR